MSEAQHSCWLIYLITIYNFSSFVFNVNTIVRVIQIISKGSHNMTSFGSKKDYEGQNW